MITKQVISIYLLGIAGLDRDDMFYTVEHDPADVDWRKALSAVSVCE
jgi:hypothetical protein